MKINVLLAALFVSSIASSAGATNVVNPAGTVLLKHVRLSIDEHSNVYVALGRGIHLYPGADGLIGTTDDVVRGFGRYPQSDSTGAKPDPLDWRILSIEGGKARLVASVIVDGIKFNLNPGDGNDWSASNLRSWLNSNGGQNLSGDQTGFFNAACNAAEQARIVATTVSISSAATFRAYNRLLADNEWQTYRAGGRNTQDHVWALSGDELFRYFGRTRLDTQKEMQQDPANYINAYFVPSAYARASGVKLNEGHNGQSFVGFGDAGTRSAGAPSDGTNYYGVFLGSTGSLNSGRPVCTVYGGLPAITVRLGR